VTTGINIICKKVFGQFLITEKPFCVVNNAEQKELQWDKETFISLQPNMDYQINVQFPYLGKGCCQAKFIIKLQPDEVQTYQYKTSMFVTSKGKIKKLK